MSDQDIVLDRLAERPDGWLLSAWLRNRHERTHEPYRYENREERKLPNDLREPSVLQKLDAAVSMLADRSTGFGAEVSFLGPEVAPLLWARPQKEVGAILDHLVESGLAKRLSIDREKGFPLRFSLTGMGWQRVDELRPLGARGNRAFVAMWFTDELRLVCDRAIDPALAACGYDPYRIDLDQFSEKIDDRILAQIRRSALLIADFTGHRQNVYFEAGFALGLGVPVVWLCRGDELKTLHFDIRQYPCVEWSEAVDLQSKLEARIAALYPRVPVSQRR